MGPLPMTEVLHRWAQSDRPMSRTESRHDIDEMMKSGSRMGPFGLIHTVCLATCVAMLDTLHSESHDTSDAAEPTPLRVITARDLGRKPRRAIFEGDVPRRRGVGA